MNRYYSLGRLYIQIDILDPANFWRIAVGVHPKWIFDEAESLTEWDTDWQPDAHAIQPSITTPAGAQSFEPVADEATTVSREATRKNWVSQKEGS